MSALRELARVADLLEGEVRTDEPLARYTTYRLGGPASLLIEPASTADVEKVAQKLRELDEKPPILIVGRGSNLVVSDHGFPGLVLRLGRTFSWIRPWEGVDGGVEAGAAATQPQVANWAARRGLSGVEWMVAVPGSVGGAVKMNAGAHGGEMAAVLREAVVFDLDRPEVRVATAGDLGFSYRRSSVEGSTLVLEARMGLRPVGAQEVITRMEAFRDHRARTQPGALQNAGSVFKNPPGDAAGRLVEAAGLKGSKVGGASVSELHANFFIAGEGSTAQDVRDLVTLVRERVRERFGVDLEPEIRFVGSFD